jgi:hypothetical protein
LETDTLHSGGRPGNGPAVFIARRLVPVSRTGLSQLAQPIPGRICAARKTANLGFLRTRRGDETMRLIPADWLVTLVPFVNADPIMHITKGRQTGWSDLWKLDDLRCP